MIFVDRCWFLPQLRPASLVLRGSFRNTRPVEAPILTNVTRVDDEAAAWVAAEIARLRDLTYEALLAEGHPERRRIETADGKTLGIETQVVFDDGERRNVRVLVDVWDPSKRLPGSIARDDFIRAPDGSFVGE